MPLERYTYINCGRLSSNWKSRLGNTTNLSFCSSGIRGGWMTFQTDRFLIIHSSTVVKWSQYKYFCVCKVTCQMAKKIFWKLPKYLPLSHTWIHQMWEENTYNTRTRKNCKILFKPISCHGQYELYFISFLTEIRQNCSMKENKRQPSQNHVSSFVQGTQLESYK